MRRGLVRAALVQMNFNMSESKKLVRLLVVEPVRHDPGHAAFFIDMRNRVEHQKLNQEAAELPPG